MANDQVSTIYRKDYRVFDFVVNSLHLHFILNEETTTVVSTAEYERNPQARFKKKPLVLSGEELEILSVKLDGEEIAYQVHEKHLTLENVPDKFVLEITTHIYPEKNSSLEGLYKSSGNYCTQCEAEGFRKITYYPDRPDVLTVFTTRIEADQDDYPVLLSNGNLIEKGVLDGKRHYAVWNDPFPKPCYLFALVAGRLVAIEDEFVTKSGRVIELKIYVEERNRDKCTHAMTSLKKSMLWDEEVFGLEYDLDIFMIVAVDDFNMGAMENKGLNIFNSKYVLTTPETGTDQDFLGVEGVIAHEYFHNWTGNRVTCRDWFQLSLKEGLTVFRDQEFSADMNSRPVQRIDDVRLLKKFQFKEDASPMAHSVRPDSYIEINNFYTSTVYNKGAEVIRMMHTLLGTNNFRKGMDLYFERHDGQAVTCDDFVAAMSDASGIDLEQFKYWYSQAGTPLLRVATDWNGATYEFVIVIEQTCPDTPGQKDKKPFHMPIKIGLVAEDGSELISTDSPDNSVVLELKEKNQKFVFQGIGQKPIVSFLRDFSAPIKIEQFQSRNDLANLAKFDPNLFNKWDSFNRLSGEIILEVAEKIGVGEEYGIDEGYLDTVEKILQTSEEDPALLALSLQLPSEATLAQIVDIIDPRALHHARQTVKKVIAKRNKTTFQALYAANQEQEGYSIDPAAMARRSLKNVSLNYLMSSDPVESEIVGLCSDQYYNGGNMTDTIGSLSCLTNFTGQLRETVFEDFFKKWSENPLVLDKWFSLQAISWLPDTLEKVKALLDHPAFAISNPNKVRALIGSFCSGNHYRFHDSDGSGYAFLRDRILQLNEINPQIAARLVSPLINWRNYEPRRAGLMQGELEKLRVYENLSKDVYEIVSKSLRD